MYLLVIVIALTTVYYLWNRRKLYKLAWNLNGPTGLPLIGISYWFADSTKIISNLGYLKAQYGSLAKIWLGQRLFVYVDSPKDIETILTSQICLDKGASYKFIQNFLGMGLVTSHGQRWKEHRKLLNPSFHYNITNKFIPIFNKHLRILVKNLEQKQHQTFDMLDYLKSASMDMICETTMDNLTKTQSGENENYLKAVHMILEVTGIRMFKPWLQPDYLFRLSSYFHPAEKSLKILNNRIDEIIEHKNKTFIATTTSNKNLEDAEGLPKEKHIFIDRVLKLAREENKFTYTDVRDESNTVLLAGYETTATSAAFVMLMLAMHPNYQQQVYEEISCINLSDDNDVTSDELSHLKFLDMVIKETMRLFPAVPYLTRETSSELKLGQHTIPTGVEFVMGVIHMQRSKEHYPNNPNSFDPDNFLPENIARRHPFSFLPFSAGPRSCIGTRYANNVLRLITIYVVKNFTLTTQLKLEDLNCRMNITLNLLNKHLVQVHKRTK